MSTAGKIALVMVVLFLLGLFGAMALNNLAENYQPSTTTQQVK